MPAPLVIWGLIAGASALSGLGYAGYKAWDEKEKEEARAQQARNAAREANAKREQERRQAHYQQQLRILQTHITAEINALGLNVTHKPSLNELMAWAALADDDSAKAPINDSALFSLLDVTPAKKAVLADLLIAMEDTISLDGHHPLLPRLVEIQQLQEHDQALSALEAHLTKTVAD